MTTAITKDFLKTLRADIDAALQAVGEKHGVLLRAGNCSFTENSATFKLEATLGVSNPADAAAVKAAASWKVNAVYFDMNPLWLGKSFKLGADSYEILGLQPKSRTKPVLTRKGGSLYVFPTEVVISAMAKSAVAA